MVTMIEFFWVPRAPQSEAGGNQERFSELVVEQLVGGAIGCGWC